MCYVAYWVFLGEQVSTSGNRPIKDEEMVTKLSNSDRVDW